VGKERFGKMGNCSLIYDEMKGTSDRLNFFLKKKKKIKEMEM
jgi:hypothetical protein